jgi:hypothetical protein
VQDLKFRRRAARRLRAVLLASSVLAAAMPPARADNLQGLGVLPGGSYSRAYGVSADGSTVVGVGNSTTLMIAD